MWPNSRPESCPQPQVSITLSFPLQTWMNVSTDPESVKAAASASTPRAATPASAHPAWRSTQRTQGIAQVETPGRKGEAGPELGKEPRRFPEPEQEREGTQGPVMTRVCWGPASGSPLRTVPPQTRETAETSGPKLGCVNISQASPLPHLPHSSRESSHFRFLEGEPWSRAPVGAGKNPWSGSPAPVTHFHS